MSAASERGVLELIAGIKSGTINPKGSISPEERRACVEYLLSEGLSVVEIAKLLSVTDRTIRRDREMIREENALKEDPTFAGRCAGRLFADMDSSIEKIRRLMRDPQASPQLQLEGQVACVQLQIQTLKQLQSMGYLPTAAAQLQAEITVGAAPSFNAIETETKRLLELALDGGNVEEAERLEKLLNETRQHELSSRVKRVPNLIEEENHDSA